MSARGRAGRKHGQPDAESHGPGGSEEREFLELRRKVRRAEVLSASIERLLRAVRFTGKLSVVVQNGRVLKSGYEEGYFSHRGEARLLDAGAAAVEP